MLTAEDNLRLAYQYTEKWSEVQRVGSAAKVGIGGDDALKFAAKHLNEARRLDPNVRITIDHDGKPETWTLDQITARNLYQGTLGASGFDRSKFDFEDKQLMRMHDDIFEEAINSLRKAVQYDPQPHYYAYLARLLTRMYRREDALEAVQKALSSDPTNFDANTVLNSIESNPNCGVRPKKSWFGSLDDEQVRTSYI